MRLARAVLGMGKDDNENPGGGDEGLVVGSLRICVAEAGTAVKPYSVIGFADIVICTWCLESGQATLVYILYELPG